MPVLPHLYPRDATAATDTRILDSRQLQDAAHNLAKRIPLPQTLQPRASGDGTIIAIPYFYQYGGPSPGAVAGIVLGSIAAFLLLVWLLWSLSNGTGFIRSSQYEEEDVYVRSSRRDRERSRSRRSSRRTEMTSRSPVRAERRERVIRQERIVRDIPPPREPSRIRETVIVDEMPRVERRVEGDDIVEVIEEHSSIGGPPPRRKSRGSRSGYRRDVPGGFSDL